MQPFKTLIYKHQFSHHGKRTYPCYNCIFPKSRNTINQSCDEQGIVAPVAGFGGVLQAMLTIKLIISRLKNFSELILFDTFGRNFQKIKIKRNPDVKFVRDNQSLFLLLSQGTFPLAKNKYF